MRASEIQALRHWDLKLTWSAGEITAGELIVPKSKTAAGTGRLIPLTRRVCACLTLWLSRVPNVDPDAFVFPFHRVGIGGNSRSIEVYDLDATRPMGSWRKAWLKCCKSAGVRYRWHDLRHTFISRLAENASVSEQTIRALAGHVSRQMLERYSHIRSQAKQAAIRVLEEQAGATAFDEIGHKNGHNSETTGTQDPAKSLDERVDT